MFCTQCGEKTDKDDNYCGNCGAQINGAREKTLPTHSPSFKGDQKIFKNENNNKHESKVNHLEYYKEYLGHKNKDYYLSNFNRYLNGKAIASFNYSASLLSFIWAIYRKMYLLAFAYMLIVFIAIYSLILLIGILNINFFYAYTFTVGLTSIIIGSISNIIYYMKIKNIIKKEMTRNKSREDICKKLRYIGGTLF